MLYCVTGLGGREKRHERLIGQLKTKKKRVDRGLRGLQMLLLDGNRRVSYDYNVALCYLAMKKKEEKHETKKVTENLKREGWSWTSWSVDALIPVIINEHRLT